MSQKDGIKRRVQEAPTKDERKEVIAALDYEVGFAKPPENSRFQKGNTFGKGRPKSSKNEATLLDEAFNEKIEVVENGKKVRKTKKQVAFKQLANKAASGDPQALKMYFDLLSKRGKLKEAEGNDIGFDDKDYEALAAVFAPLSPEKEDVA